MALRPSIKISPKICKRTGVARYGIKVINKSFFPAYDLKASLSKTSPLSVKNGTNKFNEVLTLKRDYLSEIKPKKIFSSKEYGDFAVIFNTDNNIEEILSATNQTVEFQISLRHGLTGISKTFNMSYTNRNDLGEGNFIFGDNLNIH